MIKNIQALRKLISNTLLFVLVKANELFSTYFGRVAQTLIFISICYLTTSFFHQFHWYYLNQSYVFYTLSMLWVTFLLSMVIFHLCSIFHRGPGTIRDYPASKSLDMSSTCDVEHSDNAHLDVADCEHALAVSTVRAQRGSSFHPVPSQESRHPLQRDCRHCGSRPLRYHHCRICGICVSHMDHHCVWLNTCVGHRNHIHFILFLIWIAVAVLTYLGMTGYVVWMTGNVPPSSLPGIFRVPVGEAELHASGLQAWRNACTVALFSLAIVLLLLPAQIYVALTGRSTLEFLVGLPAPRGLLGQVLAPLSAALPTVGLYFHITSRVRLSVPAGERGRAALLESWVRQRCARAGLSWEVVEAAMETTVVRAALVGLEETWPMEPNVPEKQPLVALGYTTTVRGAMQRLLSRMRLPWQPGTSLLDQDASLIVSFASMIFIPCIFDDAIAENWDFVYAHPCAEDSIAKAIKTSHAHPYADTIMMYWENKPRIGN